MILFQELGQVVSRRMAFVLAGASFMLTPHRGVCADKVGTTRIALMGDVSYGDDCSEEWKQFNEEIMKYGRVAAASQAFEECLDTEIRAKYRKCNGDPFYDAAIDEQIEMVLRVARGPNDVHINCTGGNGNASAFGGSYGNSDDEVLSWGGWFAGVYSHLGDPVCGPGVDPNNCSYAALPWPYSQAAGIVWHESMHEQGYGHGANEQASAIVACGYETDSTWDFQVNTMPYIVGNCISAVIDRSGAECGDVDSCPGSNQLKLVNGYDSQTCECENDPGQEGLGILRFEYPRLVDAAILPFDDSVGGWHYARSNQIVGTGDFNGDGNGDFIITSGWGMGIITHNGSQWSLLMAAPNGTAFGGWIWQTGASFVKGIGDFNADGHDDILVTNSAGVGILTYSASSLTSLMVKPNGTWFGGWNFNSQDNWVRGVADFNGNGRADVLVTSPWGIGILTYQSSSMTSLVAKPNGTLFGGWNFNSQNDVVKGLADFDGNGRADILLTSVWGIGILRYQSPTLNSLVAKPHGTVFGGWNYANTNTIQKVADFNADGRADILITSGWGIGILTRQSSTLNSLMVKPNGTSFGGWSFSSNANTIAAVGLFDYDSRPDILIRSAWGMALLELSGTTLQSLFIAENGTLLGSWPLESPDQVMGVDYFAGAFGDSVLFRK